MAAGKKPEPKVAEETKTPTVEETTKEETKTSTVEETTKEESPPAADEDPVDLPKLERHEKTVEELASEVLAGHWGDYKTSRQRLLDHEYDASAVQREVNRRMAGGASYTYKSDYREVATQIIRGEWGPDNTIESRLSACGYNVREVAREVDKQLGN